MNCPLWWNGRMVMVSADVGLDGGIVLHGVTEATSGKIVDVDSCKVEERLALYEACREAAGICMTCGGAKRIRRIQGPKRPGVEIKCPTCQGTGQAPAARLNPDTPTKKLPELGAGPLRPTPPPSGLGEILTDELG